MTELLIARHGNTFAPGETPLRVGARTDLPLSESGRKQAHTLGHYLKQNYPDLAHVFTSELKRTIQMAEIALTTANFSIPVEALNVFNEIDYGPDEAQPEEAVIARIGQSAIDAWNCDAIIPEGWRVNPKAIIDSWQQFATHIIANYPNQTVLVITSNGIARFAPHLLDSPAQFSKKYELKMATGAISEFKFEQNHWQLQRWNYRPVK